MIQPDCMADDFGRKTVSVVKLVSIIHAIGTDKLTLQPQKNPTITVILDNSTYPGRKGAKPK